MRVRGLKHYLRLSVRKTNASHPMRVRGLKQIHSALTTEECEVAPHAGAWIETDFDCVPVRVTIVAPHAGAWIETHSA